MLHGLVGGKQDGGVTFYDESGTLRDIGLDFMTISDAFHAEAFVLLQVLRQGQERVGRGQRKRVLLFSDCKNLVDAVNGMDTQSLPSWEAAHTVANCIQLAQELKEFVTIRYTTRDALTGPHKLANWARLHSQRGRGISFNTITSQLQIPNSIDACFFKIQAETLRDV